MRRYKQRLNKPKDIESRYIKQSGGKGQYAVAGWQGYSGAGTTYGANMMLVWPDPHQTDDKYAKLPLELSEFKSEETFKEFQASGHLRELRADYDKHFGTTSDRAGTGWVQVFP